MKHFSQKPYLTDGALQKIREVIDSQSYSQVYFPCDSVFCFLMLRIETDYLEIEIETKPCGRVVGSNHVDVLVQIMK